MSEARIGHRPAAFSTGETSILRPEVFHQFPRIRLVSEQTVQSRQEASLKNPGASQEMALVAGIRAEIAQESQPTEVVPFGVSTIENVVKGEQNRPRSMKSSGLLTPVRWDTYITGRPDGKQEIYLQRHPERSLQIIGKIYPQEEGVWKEVWSEPRGRKGKRIRLGRPERVGEVAKAIGVETPDGTESTRLEIYSKEFIEKQIAIAQERAKRINEILPAVRYIPQEHDEILQQIHKDQLRQLLQSTKETLPQQAWQTVKQLSVSGTSSLVFWFPHLLPGAGWKATHKLLSMGISLTGNSIINKNISAGKIEDTFKQVGGIFLGLGIGSLLPIPFGGLIGGALGFVGVTAWSNWEKYREFRKFVKAHPEITDNIVLQSLYQKEQDTKNDRKQKQSQTQENDMQARMRIVGLEKFGRLPQYSKEFFEAHKETVEQIREKMPDATPIEVGIMVDRLQLKYHESADVSKYYLDKAMFHFARRTFGVPISMFASYLILPHVPFVGAGIAHLFETAPIYLSAAFTTWGAIVNPLVMHNNVKAIREEMKQNHPELLRELGNGKNVR